MARNLYRYLVLIVLIFIALCILKTGVETKTYGAIQTNYLSETVEMTEENTIKFNLIGTDSNDITCSLKLSDITIIVGTTEVPQNDIEDITLGEVNYPTSHRATCLLTLKGVPGEGKLKIKIAGGTLTDSAGNTNEETTLATEVTMVASGVNAAEVVAEPTAYYGKTVNYEANGITDWKIFYADNDNIFLITSDYIPKGKIPTSSTGMGTLVEGDYACWNSVPTPQTVTSLNSSFMFTKYSDYSSYSNGKCVSTLLNTSNWTNFVNSNYADYAIGGSTLEMWLETAKTIGYLATYSITVDSYGYNATISGSYESDMNNLLFPRERFL